MKLNLYGRQVKVTRFNDQWRVFYLGTEGKHRHAIDIVIPSDLKESEVVSYLEDLYHEHASEKYPTIKVLK